MIWTILSISGICVFAIALTAFVAGRLPRRRFFLSAAIANVFHLVASVGVDNTGHASINAGVLAVCVWVWWNDGGGDDTRRRLRSWAARFRGVRRTAPVGGAV